MRWRRSPPFARGSARPRRKGSDDGCRRAEEEHEGARADNLGLSQLALEKVSKNCFLEKPNTAHGHNTTDEVPHACVIHLLTRNNNGLSLSLFGSPAPVGRLIARMTGPRKTSLRKARCSAAAAGGGAVEAGRRRGAEIGPRSCRDRVEIGSRSGRARAEIGSRSGRDQAALAKTSGTFQRKG